MSNRITSIALSNPKSPENMGAIMRAVGCFSADAVYYTGKRYDRAMSFQTDTKNKVRSIPLKSVENLISSAPEHAKIICIELVENATPIHEFKHPDNAYYIFGPEDGTLDQKIIDVADSVVYIPTIGCLNLAATVNIVLYDRWLKSNNHLANNALITKSKDRNNKLKYKN